MGATVDCEAIGSGVLSQPVNSLTSLALVIAGAVVFTRIRDVWLSAALAAAGIGSFLFHGPLAPGGEWIHDVTLAWLILVLGLHGRNWERRLALPGLVTLAAVLSVAPSLGDPITLALLAGTLTVLLLDEHRRRAALPLALLIGAAVVGRLGSTRGPLCDADSVLQTHGLWHIGAAVAITWWVTARARHVELARSH